jgi:AraC-like DNA-binding protein
VGVFFTTNKFGISTCLMYIFRMKRHYFFIAGIFLLAWLVLAKDPGRLLPAPKKSLSAPSPLFSVSGMKSRDSVMPAIPIQGKDAKPMQLKSSGSLTHDSVPTESCATDTHPKFNAIAVDTAKALGAINKIDSARTIKAEKPSIVRSTAEDKSISQKPLQSPSQSESKKTNVQKISKPRQHGMRALVDVRFGILLLSIIIIGAFLRFALKKANQPTFVTTTRLSIMDKEVQTAARYIEKNYKNPELSLDNICESLITGKAFLDALFQQELGLGVGEFITQVRINRARMLIEKDTSVSADMASSESGFKEVTTFTNAFAAIVGMPFDHYRDARAKNAV